MANSLVVPEGFAGAVVAFDIETVGSLTLAQLPERERLRLQQRARDELGRNTPGEIPSEGAFAERIERALALNPLTARVVAVAFQVVDGPSLVVVASDDAETRLHPPSHGVAEAELLAWFWQIAAAVRVLIGFNSRGFDVPVLLTRSARLRVPAGVELMADVTRPDGPAHIDLHEILRAGGERRPSLELAAAVFDIPAKQAGHGSEVASLYREGRLDELAAYNLEDARATAALYQRLRGTWL